MVSRKPVAPTSSAYGAAAGTAVPQVTQQSALGARRSPHRAQVCRPDCNRGSLKACETCGDRHGSPSPSIVRYGNAMTSLPAKHRVSGECVRDARGGASAKCGWRSVDRNRARLRSCNRRPGPVLSCLRGRFARDRYSSPSCPDRYGASSSSSSCCTAIPALNARARPARKALPASAGSSIRWATMLLIAPSSAK